MTTKNLTTAHMVSARYVARKANIQPPHVLQKFQLWLASEYPRQEFTLEYHLGGLSEFFIIKAGISNFVVYERSVGEHFVRWMFDGEVVGDIEERTTLPGLREFKAKTVEILAGNPKLYAQFEALSTEKIAKGPLLDRPLRPRHNVPWSDVMRGVKEVQAWVKESRRLLKMIRKGDSFKGDTLEILNRPFSSHTDPLYLWFVTNLPHYHLLQHMTQSIRNKIFDIVRGAGVNKDVNPQTVSEELASFERNFTAQFNPGPAQYSYKGFKILNPHRMSDVWLTSLHDAIDYMLSIFKKRGVDDLLTDNIRSVTVLPYDSQGRSAGRYFSTQQRIEMYANGLKARSGKFLRTWVHELFLHEFGHYVHMNHITNEARKFWNSGWDLVDKAEQDINQEMQIIRADRDRFWDLLTTKNFNITSASSQLDSLERVKFHFWLQHARFLKNDRVTPEGTEAMEFLAATVDQRIEMHLNKEWGGDWREKVRQEALIGLKPAYPSKREAPELAREAERYVEIQWDNTAFLVKGKRTSINISLNLHNGKSIPVPEKFWKGSLNTDELRELSKARDQRTEDLGIPSGYGRTNVLEDFAESFVLWIRNPRKLSKIAQYRMARTLWLSGYGGKPVMKMGSAEEALGLAKAYMAKQRTKVIR